MRRRALLAGLLVGALAVLSRALKLGPVLDIPVDPEDGGEGEVPQHPPTTQQPPPPEPAPLEPDDDDEEERPPTEPA